MNTQLATAGAGQLINVFPSFIGGVPASVCDGRELHSFLKVARDFSTWIKQRIQKYGFEEGRDFVTVQNLSDPKSGSSKDCSPKRGSNEVSPNSGNNESLIPQNGEIKSGRGGHNRVEYHLCLDMAKELSMVENNDRGREARRYFIEMERRALQGAGVAAPASHLDTLLPSEQQTLSEIAHRRAEEANDAGKALAEIWSRLHHKFRVAKYSQLPRTQLAEAMLYVASMELRANRKPCSQPLTVAQREKLAHQIHRAHWCQYLRLDSAKRAVCNRLRVRFNLRDVEELPAEHFDEAMAMLEEMYRQTHAFQHAVRELGDAFIKDVLNDGEPWTPFIKRKIGAVALGSRPDWRKIARQIASQPSVGAAT